MEMGKCDAEQQSAYDAAGDMTPMLRPPAQRPSTTPGTG
jgi:hypothetical protein